MNFNQRLFLAMSSIEEGRSKQGQQIFCINRKENFFLAIIRLVAEQVYSEFNLTNMMKKIVSLATYIHFFKKLKLVLILN